MSSLVVRRDCGHLGHDDERCLDCLGKKERAAFENMVAKAAMKLDAEYDTFLDQTKQRRAEHLCHTCNIVLVKGTWSCAACAACTV